MTRLWRAYAIWWGGHDDHPVPQWRYRFGWWVFSKPARLLVRAGFLAKPASRSGHFCDYEWQWRFWRGPYWRHMCHSCGTVHTPPIA